MLEQLRPLHNFTIESQVQYYAPLAFEPPMGMHAHDDSKYYALGEEELKMFVNSGEWSLGMFRLCDDDATPDANC